MVQAEVWCTHLGDWHGQLRESETGDPIGEEFLADQRGMLIGKISNWVPLTHLAFKDVAPQ